MEGAGNVRIREEHRMRVINVIRAAGSISRIEIGKILGLSGSTVTRVVERLITEGVVIESGISPAHYGRKPINLSLNPDAYYCIGVNISKKSIHASLVDFAMGLKKSLRADIRDLQSGEALIERVCALIEELLHALPHPERLLGIGVGVPGTVDFTSGDVLDFGFTHHLARIPLRDILEKRFNFKVMVDNNANTRALGELWFGYAAGCRNMAFVICSEGIGAGIISDGEIVRGKTNITGEIGHQVVLMDGRPCACGKRGCVEAYCATDNIEAQAAEAGRPDADLRIICRLAERNDPICAALIERVVKALATGVQNMVGMFSPELVVLSGTLFDACPTLFTRVVETINSPDVRFLNRKIDDNLYEIGAAALIYKSFFKD